MNMLLPKNAAFWDVTPCGSCKNRHFGGTSVLITAPLRKIPEDSILHNHRRGNLKSYMVLLPSGWKCMCSCYIALVLAVAAGKLNR
jgi:hypothetical protein